MKLPVIQGTIERRMLVNYRAEADVLQRLLPSPFRPQVVRGKGIAGICLIRLNHVRPRFVPVAIGLASENAAHRIAVEWDEDGQTRHGVYIPRRDTSSRLNTLIGGRLFPGVHHHADFHIDENGEALHVALTSDDEAVRVSVSARVADELPAGSVFRSIEEASTFFEGGSVGYSATNDPSRLHGLELRCRKWQVQPLAVEHVQSSFFDDRSTFPDGSIEFDCALLMSDIEHEWHSREDFVI